MLFLGVWQIKALHSQSSGKPCLLYPILESSTKCLLKIPQWRNSFNLALPRVSRSSWQLTLYTRRRQLCGTASSMVIVIHSCGGRWGPRGDVPSCFSETFGNVAGEHCTGEQRWRRENCLQTSHSPGSSGACLMPQCRGCQVKANLDVVRTSIQKHYCKVVGRAIEIAGTVSLKSAQSSESGGRGFLL